MLIIWGPIETKAGVASDGQIEAALHELKTAGLIKTYGAWGMAYPIRIDGEGAWKHVLTSQKPPAWQYEEEYSNMTTNNNISIGDHATVGVAGTNSGIAVTGSSIMLSLPIKFRVFIKILINYNLKLRKMN